MGAPNNLAQQSRRATRVLTEEGCWAPLGLAGIDALAASTTAGLRTAAGIDPAVVGVAAGTGVVATNSYGVVQQTLLTLTAASVPTTDNGAAGANGTLEIFDFPEGLVHIFGAVANLTTAKVSTGLATTAALVWSLGTATSAADATLTSTEADIIPSTAGTLTAGVGTFIAVSTTPALFDGTGTAKKCWLNCAVVDAGTSANDAVLVSGTIRLTWAWLGDK